MPFDRLVYNLLALRKLADRAIALEEIVEVLSGVYCVTENRAARVDGSVLAIGQTAAGRMLVMVLDPIDGVRWRLMTAWDATAAQTRLYRNAR